MGYRQIDEATKTTETALRKLLRLPDSGANEEVDRDVNDLLDGLVQLAKECGDDQVDRAFNRGDYRY